MENSIIASYTALLLAVLAKYSTVCVLYINKYNETSYKGHWDHLLYNMYMNYVHVQYIYIYSTCINL